MKRTMVSAFCVLGLAACSGGDDDPATTGGGNGGNGGGEVLKRLYWAVFHDDVSDSAKSRLQAIEMAVARSMLRGSWKNRR